MVKHEGRLLPDARVTDIVAGREYRLDVYIPRK